MSKRIYFNRYEGEKLPPDTKLVGRGSRYGNPYKVKDYGREEALRLYRIYLEEGLREGTIDLSPLIGKNLACTCKLSEPCHADILLEYVLKEEDRRDEQGGDKRGF
jgi:hypothetical protein